VVCNMLASRATAGNSRAAFLQLPFRLRQLSHQQSTRSFSATASNKIELTEVVAAPPLAVLNGLHLIGIPWYAAIPTAAILIRGIFGYYFAAAPARRRHQIRNNLTPLVGADVGLSIARDTTGFNKGGKVPPLLRIQRSMSRSHQLGKRFGAPLIAWSSFVNFGLLITTSEAIRMKCGAHEGLLSLVLSPFRWVLSIFLPTSFPPAADPAEVRAQELAERLEHVREMRLQQAQEQTLGADGQAISGQSSMSENLFHSTELSAPRPINVDSSYFDPTLQTEGLSWCADLTVCDPYTILPLATAAAMLVNIFLNPLTISRRVAGAQSMPGPIRFFMTRYSPMQNFSMALTCLFGYVMQVMPAGIVLYIFSSVITGFVQRKWLDLSMPLRKPIMPCARGTRVRSKKAWSGKI
jgi:inner membrane protein COX18